MTGLVLIWIIGSIICLASLIAEARAFLQNEAATVGGLAFFGIMCFFAMVPFFNAAIGVVIVIEFFTKKIWPSIERRMEKLLSHPLWNKKIIGPFNKSNSNKKVV